MKKYLLISLFVLMTLGLFVACNADAVGTAFKAEQPAEKPEEESMTAKFVRLYADKCISNTSYFNSEGKLNNGTIYTKFEPANGKEYLLGTDYKNSLGTRVPLTGSNALFSYFVYENNLYYIDSSDGRTRQDICEATEKALSNLKNGEALDSFVQCFDLLVLSDKDLSFKQGSSEFPFIRFDSEPELVQPKK